MRVTRGMPVMPVMPVGRVVIEVADQRGWFVVMLGIAYWGASGLERVEMFGGLLVPLMAAG